MGLGYQWLMSGFGGHVGGAVSGTGWLAPAVCSELYSSSGRKRTSSFSGKKANLIGSEQCRTSKGPFLHPARLQAVFQLQPTPPCVAPGSGLCQEPNGFSLAMAWRGSAKHNAQDPGGEK